MLTYTFKSKFIYPVLIGILCLTILSCAEIGPPPGGEIDKSAPDLIASYPEPMSTNITLDNDIVLTFSERIKAPTSQSVFISPQQQSLPNVKIKGERIIISLSEPLTENSTYVITVSSSIADLRGNKLDSSISVAFSTGAVIDSGQISGRLFFNGTPFPSGLIGLYPISELDSSLNIDSLKPFYTTTSNNNGEFNFNYLRSDDYLLVGFDDKNNNLLLNENKEAYGLPDRKISLISRHTLSDLNILLNLQDTLTPSILSTSLTNDGLVRIRFSKTIDLKELRYNPEQVMLRTFLDSSLDNSSDDFQLFPAKEFMEVYDSSSNIVSTWFDSIPENDYQAVYNVNLTGEQVYSTPFEYKYIEDQTAPTITNSKPGRFPQFANELNIEIIFSEPVDQNKLNDESITLFIDSLTRVPLSLNWETSNWLKITPEQIKPGSRYRLDIIEFDIADLSGNTLGDSLTQISFNTLHDDSLGWISGNLLLNIEEKNNDLVLLSFQNLATNVIYNKSLSGSRPFKVTVPAGKYLATAFVDSDLDGKYTYGKLSPFTNAETFVSFPDTIQVRARFETSELQLEIK